MPLPPEVDDAISPRSTLRPPRKSFAFALRTAAVPPVRCIGTRKCRNVKPLRFRDTALAALLRYLLQLRCCTPLPLCNTLFQRLSLLSDTSLVQSAYKAETSRYVLHYELEIYYHRLLSHIAVHSHYSPYGRADLSHRCSLATLTRSVRRRAFPAIGYGNTSCRSEHRNKRVSQCEASTSPRHRTRCAPTVSAPSPMLHTAAALQHTLSTAIAVVRYLPLPKPHL